MGKPDDPTACTDSDFKVLGLEALRVADLSSIPFVPNCHTMACGYLIGWHCAEKIVAEYGLDA
jgi:choline dehydrogenase-like flavoprotein